MTHGARDWSNIGPDEVVYGLNDMAELAARLGSPITHSREGNVIFVETFEAGLQPWNPTEEGAGTEIRISNENYRSSGYSCRMITGTGAGAHAVIYRRFPYPVILTYGLEFSVLLNGIYDELVATLEYNDGEVRHTFSIRYVRADEEIQIYNEAGAWVTVEEGVQLLSGYGLFHTFKLVVDLRTLAFCRLLVNHDVTDLGDYFAFDEENVQSPHILVSLDFITGEGYAPYCYVDDIILTQNEPP